MQRNNYFIPVIFTTVLISAINPARIPLAGGFVPYESETDSQNQSRETDDKKSISNENETHEVGPSLDLIDAHPHSHDDDNASAIETAKRPLIQPSIEFLDAQLHGGDEHVHDHNNNETGHRAADLNDFQNWLKEQNQTDQLNRFLQLQKEMKQLDLNDKKSLTLIEKLNRTIEELKAAWRDQQERKHEL
ncbi:unnamed protein product [Adineta ricciae]|uniref:Uncharacterized protein n=1 Tax=Adineta ricciae TaxID=249248 RepID=A0A816GPU5_ADIRI|nr:unnamed protein product [Adineta ricciae]CAF1675952.1 unnamed protein product [Adineta ricciae]